MVNESKLEPAFEICRPLKISATYISIKTTRLSLNCVLVVSATPGAATTIRVTNGKIKG